jgi:S-DNA-T family DNA segregation ATPase FtsK/SpoIIIE
VRKEKKKYLQKYKKEASREINDKPQLTEARPYLKSDTKKGILIVLVITLAVISCLSLFGLAGRFGQAIDTGLKYLLGWGKFILPLLLIALAYFISQSKKETFRLSSYTGLGLLVLCYSALISLIASSPERISSDIAGGRGGGYLGLVLSYPLEKIMGPWATGVILAALLLIAFLVLFDASLKRLYSGGNVFSRMMEKFREFFYKLKTNMNTTAQGPEDGGIGEPEPQSFNTKEIGSEAVAAQPGGESPAVPAENKTTEKQLGMFEGEKRHVIRKIEIPIDLLESSNTKPTSGDIEVHKEKIHQTLKNFGIDVEMGETKVGPTVTQYTLKPSEGVKLSQITTLGNDLALALAAHPIRIEAPIPGKSLVGIEVPNEAVAIVKLKELLMSSEFKKRKSKLTVALGKDVAGHTWLADLDPMPHLLIAGATGSGKSVCLNTILLSLLYQNSPDELKLILVDPKRVELTGYNDIPHLLTPVVTETNKTINALRWVVAEMDRRFEVLSKSGHRNIQSYNHDNGGLMPYLVLAIDELADLMSVAANEVEAAIIRLAQMARAVGIHLILATQRPSVDIITGLIKANITSRIAFSVASLVDSRTILDTSGAEKLLGRGDLLYISPQLSKPKRLQGAYVNDQEISRVLNYLKSQAKPDYEEQVTSKVIDRTLIGNFEDLADDELIDQAEELVVKAGKASASFLQRRLRIGYARAARILDILEERGVIGPGDGAKPRDILITSESPAEDENFKEDFENGEAADKEQEADDEFQK